MIPSMTSTPSRMPTSSTNELPSSSPSSPAPSMLPSAVPSEANTYEPTRRPVPEFVYDVIDKPVKQRSSKNLEFCRCDEKSICFENIRGSLTPTNRLIRICLQAIPSDARLNLISTKTSHTQTSLTDPILKVENNGVNENAVVLTTELQPEFFDINNPGEITVYGMGEILAPGSRSKGQAAFFVVYDLITVSESPTLSPTSTDSPTSELLLPGANACHCEQDSVVCLENTPYLSYTSREAQLCIL